MSIYQARRKQSETGKQPEESAGDGDVIQLEGTVAAFMLILVFLAHLAGTFVNLKWIERKLAAPALGAYFAFVILLAMVLTPVNSHDFIYFNF